MLARFLMIAAVMFVVTACSSTDDETALDGQPTATDQSAGGPLSDVYGGQVAPGTQADLSTNIGDRVFFGYDQYNIDDSARMTLDKQAQWLQQYPNLSITIEGHCDERGTREYNLALGERRANAVKNYLVAAGVPSSRVSTISYGKERPAVPGSDESSYSQNRRGVTVVQ
ncbi:MAG: peptidoglycan-associated lipoprotein Pal [Alphaproteobacteria bacterium]|nr:peptidoglycan-associated lipoprotein Pal [Alphaproteobacteria bacterium]